MNKKCALAALACLLVGGAAVAQSGMSPDSMTLEIASYDSQIEALTRKEGVIQQEIANDVSTYRTTQLTQRQKPLDDLRRQGFINDADYKAELSKLQQQIEAEAKARNSEKIAEHAEELDNLGAQKKSLQDERNRLEQQLLRQSFVIRSNQVRHDQYDSSSKMFTVVVTIPQFANDTVTVRYGLSLPGGGNALAYAQKAQEEMQKTYVANVTYRIKKTDAKDTYAVYITGVEVVTAQGELVTSVQNLNQESKTFKAGKLGVSEKNAAVTTRVASAAPSTGGSDDGDAYRQIIFLLDNGLFKNKDQILGLSSALTFSQKNTIYSNYEKSPVGPFFLNMLPFGIGSWVQKDFAPAGIITGVDVLSVVLMIASSGMEEQDDDGVYYWSGQGLLAMGLVLYVGSRIFALVRPWVYANKYNKALAFSLNMGGSAVSVLPVVDPAQNRVGFVARLTL